MSRMVTPTIVRVVTLVVILGAWELYGRAQETTASFAPFSDVVVAAWGLLTDMNFWSAFGGSVFVFAVGLVLAIVFGIPVGILMGRYLIVGRFLDTYMRLLLALPTSTLVPVIIISFGIGLTARVYVVFLFAFVDIAYNTYVGMAYQNQDRIDMGRAFNLTEYQLLRYIILPSALPSIFAGLRLGTGRGLIGMVISELLLVAVGIGLLIQEFQTRFQSANLLAITAIVLAFGVAIMTTMQRLERSVLHWQKATVE